MQTIVLCAALPLEVKSLAKKFNLTPPTPQQPIQGPITHQACDIYLLASGIGVHHMKKCLENLSINYVDLWVSVGYAGALVSDKTWGECQWGNYFIDSEKNILQFNPPAIEKNSFEERPLFCASKVLTTPHDKLKCQETTGAALVDMESAAVAQNALNRQEPCLWMKIISDTLNQFLPNNLDQCMTPQGYPSTTKFTKKLITSPPKEMYHLLKMGYNSKKLSNRLAQFVFKKIDSM